MKPGRNDACPCGSGKKYKACCQNTAVHQEPAGNKPANNIASGLIDAPRLLAMFQAGQQQQLELQLKALIQQHPRSAFLWSLLGATLQTMGKDGLTALQKATTLAPPAQAQQNRGQRCDPYRQELRSERIPRTRSQRIFLDASGSLCFASNG